MGHRLQSRWEPGAPGHALRLRVPTPPQSRAWPPCPRIMGAAAREGSVAAGGCGKPIAFPPGSPGRGMFPSQTPSAAFHCSPAQLGKPGSAEPNLGQAVCRVRVPAGAGASGCEGARHVHVALPVRAWEVGRGAEGGGCHATCAGSPLR